MELKNLKKLTSKAAEEKSAQAAVAGICIAVLAGAAAGFFLAVQMEKHKRKIKSGCRPTAPNSDGALDDAAVGAPDKTGKPEKQNAPQ